MELNIWKTIILSFVQGFTWFLPLSDVGVVVLTRKLVGLPLDGSDDGLLTSICQLVAGLVVMISFRKDWSPAFRPVTRQVLRNTSAVTKIGMAKRLFVLIVLGFLPAIGSLVTKNWLDQFGQKTVLVVCVVLLGGILVFSCDRIGHGKRCLDEANFGDGFLMAIMQLVGCVPGFSSAGLGFAAGVWRGLSLDFCVKLSCLMLVPKMLLQSIWGIVSQISTGFNLSLLVGALFCGCGTYFAIRLIRFVSARKSIGEFAYFTWGTGLFLFVLYLFG